MFPAFRDSGPFLNLLPFPTGGGSSVTVTPGTPTVVGTEITFPSTSSGSLVGAVYGVEFGIGVGAGYVWSENVAGAASSQTITIDIASYGGTSSSTVNARIYYNLDVLDDPSTRVYSAMLAPIVVSASETGTTTEGETLTGANGIIVGGYQMTLSQSWSACNTAGTSCTPITAGTATTYVLTASEVGDTIKYTKTATNTAGSGSATSNASAVVASAGDPYWANVELLIANNNGANGTTTFTDQSTNGYTVTSGGNAVWSNAQAPTGLTTSVSLDGAGTPHDQLSVSTQANLGLGTGDFTIEFFQRVTGSLATTVPMDMRSGGSDVLPSIYFLSDGSIYYYANSNLISSAAGVIQSDTWQHVALCRASGTTRLFVGGVQAGSNYSDSNNYGASLPFYLGASFGGTSGIVGFMASARVTVGVARYTAAFTPPDLPFLTS